MMMMLMVMVMVMMMMVDSDGDVVEADKGDNFNNYNCASDADEDANGAPPFFPYRPTNQVVD